MADVPVPLSMQPPFLVLDPVTHPTPFDVKSAIEDSVNQLVPQDRHVVIVSVLTPQGLRFAAAQRGLGGHLEFHEAVTFAHDHGTGPAWQGEVGFVGSW